MADTPSPDRYHDFLRLLYVLGRADQSAPLRIGHQAPGQKFGQILTTPLEAVTRVLPMYAGENLWFEVNESSYSEPFGRSSEGDITRLTALWADLDFKGDDAKKPGLGSEQGAREVIDELTRILGVPPAAIVHSGNGLQPYWPIADGELPEDEDTRKLIKLVLLRWGVLVKQVARSFGGDADSVFDFPRILRIPGPPNMKAEPKPTSAEFPEGNQPFTLEELIGILDEYDIVWTDDVTFGMEPVSLMKDWNWADADCSYVSRFRADMLAANPTARHPWGVKMAAEIQGMIRYGCLTEATYHELVDEFGAHYTDLVTNTAPTRELSPNELQQSWQWAGRRAESWSDEKLVSEMRGHSHMLDAIAAEKDYPQPSAQPVDNSAPFHPKTEPATDNSAFLAFLQGSSAQNPPAQAATSPLPPFPADDDLTPAEPPQALTAPQNVTSIFTGQPVNEDAVVVDGQLALNLKSRTRVSVAAYTDTGNGEKLAAAYADRFISVPDKGWYAWQKNRFVPDAAKTHIEAAKDVFTSMAAANDYDSEKAKWARKSLNRGPLMSAIAMAETHPSLVTPAVDLDSNGYELCTPGGVFDIRAGVLRAPDARTDRHTLQTGVAPDASVPIPEFLKFISWTMSGEQERVDYLQRLLGIACIGDLLAHIFPMFIGSGGNGKGALISIVSMAMGTYTKAMPKKFLVEKPTDQHPTEIANLLGVRLAVASEVPPKAVFDEELVKTLSGDVTLTGRFMREDLIQFPNRLLTILLANHLPTLQYGGGSFARRLRKVDFREKAAVEDQTLDKRIFDAEGPGILAWMLAGARDFLQHGEQPPASVMDAARAYMQEEDTIGRFFETHYEPAPGVPVQRDVMFRAYEDWAKAQRLRVMNRITFERDIATRYPHIIIPNDDRTYLGIKKRYETGFIS